MHASDLSRNTATQRTADDPATRNAASPGGEPGYPFVATVAPPPTGPWTARFARHPVVWGLLTSAAFFVGSMILDATGLWFGWALMLVGWAASVIVAALGGAQRAVWQGRSPGWGAVREAAIVFTIQAIPPTVFYLLVFGAFTAAQR